MSEHRFPRSQFSLHSKGLLQKKKKKKKRKGKNKSKEKREEGKEKRRQEGKKERGTISFGCELFVDFFPEFFIHSGREKGVRKKDRISITLAIKK